RCHVFDAACTAQPAIAGSREIFAVGQSRPSRHVATRASSRLLARTRYGLIQAPYSSRIIPASRQNASSLAALTTSTSYQRLAEIELSLVRNYNVFLVVDIVGQFLVVIAELGMPIDLARLPVEIGFILARGAAAHEFEEARLDGGRAL